MPAGQPRFVVVVRRHEECGFGGVEPVERFLVGDGGMAARRHDLRLEPVGLDEVLEVVDQVEADRLDAAGSSRDRPLGRVALLDRGPFVVGPVGEDAVEHLVEGLADDVQLGQPALVKDRNGGLVLDGLFDGVGVDVGAERPEGAAVLLVDGGAGEAEEAGVRQGPRACWRRGFGTGCGGLRPP